jgi:DNA-directed RNA polymerase subunit M/transcription elongation factor TFIIS
MGTNGLKSLWKKLMGIFQLHCPKCDGKLRYKITAVGGDESGTDIYECKKCGAWFWI